MTINSLRSKIFLLLTGTLLVIAVFIIVISRYDVTASLSEAELHATSNVMVLAARDISTRWAASLSDKVTAVRNERTLLMETGALISSTLTRYAARVEAGQISRAGAEREAADWINNLHSSPQRHFFAYDAKFNVRASGLPAWRGRNIAGLKDFKRQPLAESMYAESRRFKYGFAMYRDGGAGDAKTRTYYAYFIYFEPLDWVIAIVDEGQGVVEQTASRKAQMEAELRESLGVMRLARSGFMFVVADDGRYVVPPSGHERLLDQRFFDELHALRTVDQDSDGEDEDARLKSFSFTAGDKTGLWHVEYHHFKPLAWTLVAMVPEGDLLAPAERLIKRQVVAFVLILLGAWFCASFVVARIVSPLTLLARFVQHLPEQDWTGESQAPQRIVDLPERYRDEIGQLATAFLTMDQKLRENIAQLMQETSLRGRIESELNIARDIQMGLLPVPLEAEAQEFVDLGAFMSPSKEVSGDLYDYFLLPDKKTLCLVIGDVSGKGVPAALFMAITRTLIRAAAEIEDDPARIMEHVNGRLAENNPNLMFVTLLIGMLHMASGEFSWANAGHPPPLSVTPAGGVEVLTGRSGPACGVKEDATYRLFRRHVSPGEMMLAYTDGVTEATAAGGAQYGEARLKAILGRIGWTHAKAIVQCVVGDVETFTAGAEQFDDITVLAVRLS
jgi:sigma-B regulation protein RsbU (phosphoserine phosphatase)